MFSFVLLAHCSLFAEVRLNYNKTDSVFLLLSDEVWRLYLSRVCVFQMQNIWLTVFSRISARLSDLTSRVTFLRFTAWFLRDRYYSYWGQSEQSSDFIGLVFCELKFYESYEQCSKSLCISYGQFFSQFWKTAQFILKNDFNQSYSQAL